MPASRSSEAAGRPPEHQPRETNSVHSMAASLIQTARPNIVRSTPHISPAPQSSQAAQHSGKAAHSTAPAKPASRSRGGKGQNIPAPALAMAVAGALKARRLILMTDVCGVLDAEKCTIPAIRIAKVASLIKDKTVTGGMIPKLQACALAVKNGVAEVVIADGSSGLKTLRGTVIKK